MASFSKAFSAARKAGKKTFSWNGKSYNTKLAASPKTPKNVPIPLAKPDQVKTGSTAKTRARAEFPKPAEDLGIARKGSALSKAKAKIDNQPVAASKKSGRVLQGEQIMSGAKARAAKAAGEIGPKQEGVWYARKGSPISIAAARRANRPVKQ